MDQQLLAEAVGEPEPIEAAPIEAEPIDAGPIEAELQAAPGGRDGLRKAVASSTGCERAGLHLSAIRRTAWWARMPAALVHFLGACQTVFLWLHHPATLRPPVLQSCRAWRRLPHLQGCTSWGKGLAQQRPWRGLRSHPRSAAQRRLRRRPRCPQHSRQSRSRTRLAPGPRRPVPALWRSQLGRRGRRGPASRQCCPLLWRSPGRARRAGARRVRKVPARQLVQSRQLPRSRPRRCLAVSCGLALCSGTLMCWPSPGQLLATQRQAVAHQVQ